MSKHDLADRGESASSGYWLRTALLFLCVLLLSWPVFGFVVSLFNVWRGEGVLLDSWELEPHRLLLEYFIEGFIRTLVITAPVAFMAVVDYKLFARRKGLQRFSGLLWFTVLGCASVAIALWLIPNNGLLLPLLVTSFFLLIGFRLFIGLFRMKL